MMSNIHIVGFREVQGKNLGGTMKFRTWIIIVQLFMIAVLVGVLAADLGETGSDESKHDDILIHFDQKDLNRMKETVQRFSEGKGDNLMLIEPTTDSGRLIHDFYSNGKELHWVKDDTRDAWSSSPGKIEYVCKAIELIETGERFNVELSQCNVQPDGEKINVISFLKERL